ncbi:MAG: hypothetical protein Kow00121_59150 [Elainellaceae cyanobacterium]
MVDKLFLSFWHLSLENLPPGRIVHTVVDAVEAGQRIKQAKQANALVCVSSDDLLAPYNQRILGEQQELCRVLQEHFGIPIAAKDFFRGTSVVDEMISVIPLEIAQISDNAALIIVTCHYSLPEVRDSGKLDFQVIPDSVEFHLMTVG